MKRECDMVIKYRIIKLPETSHPLAWVGAFWPGTIAAIPTEAERQTLTLTGNCVLNRPEGFPLPAPPPGYRWGTENPKVKAEEAPDLQAILIHGGNTDSPPLSDFNSAWFKNPEKGFKFNDPDA